MPKIILHTTINAPIERCFNLSMSIDLHKSSTLQTNEEAIAGTTTGIIGLNETVTWRAKHFGITQTLTSKITAVEKPFLFVDEMLEGAFKKLHHQHIFKFENGATLMTDIFVFNAPLGFLGIVAEKLFLENYMRKFLMARNAHVKKVAESEEWRKYVC